MTDYQTFDLRAALREAGLLACPNFLRDFHFLGALLVGAAYWGWLGRTAPAAAPLLPWPFFVLVLWQPLLEELLFRGVLQGVLRRARWARRQYAGVSIANGIVSLLFAAAHALTRPWTAASAILLPSLLYGYFRDRHASVWPAVALHMVYNAGYFLVVRGLDLS